MATRRRLDERTRKSIVGPAGKELTNQRNFSKRMRNAHNIHGWKVWEEDAQHLNSSWLQLFPFLSHTFFRSSILKRPRNATWLKLRWTASFLSFSFLLFSFFLPRKKTQRLIENWDYIFQRVACQAISIGKGYSRQSTTDKMILKMFLSETRDLGLHTNLVTNCKKNHS